jgi:pyroglutamyl-peptidase
VNPSWLAVKPLHNSVIYAEMVPQPPPEPQPGHQLLGPPPSVTHPQPEPSPNPDTEMQEEGSGILQQIHITTLQIPVVYQSVLSIIPGLHAKPPTLPETTDPAFAPTYLPPNGFDFIFHIGVVGRGPLRLEKSAHKHGYRMKDAEGQYAPVMQLPKEPPQSEEEQPAIYKSVLPELTIGDLHVGRPRVTDPDGESSMGEERPAEPEQQLLRGVGSRYETMPDELYTELDIPRLIQHLKQEGVEVCHPSFVPGADSDRSLSPQKVYSSMDAGHFLPDFLFYCSLAEAKKASNHKEKDKAARSTTPPKMTPVLSMNCSPVGRPFKSEEVTSVIKKVICWVCARLSR